jgi:hypothetical protein
MLVEGLVDIFQSLMIFFGFDGKKAKRLTEFSVYVRVPNGDLWHTV